jgi:polar amino acid transport system substrate-binding protein
MRSPRPWTTTLLSLLVIVAATALSACGSSNSSSSPATTADLSSCTPDKLDTHSSGKLTVATDSPAYPPYFASNDPTNGRGFESAVAYAIAQKLGFDRSQVDWTVEPFNASYAPGSKNFDFDVNEISITPQRSKEVDFSSPYYTAGQAVVALKGSSAASATSLADLKDANIGVQIGTTSLDAVNNVIQPNNAPKVFDNSNDVVTALKEHSVDAVVVDVPTAFYLTQVQVPDAEVVGQFAAPGGDQWGALLQKGSSLTACVTAAVDALRQSGELASLERKWISDKANAPVIH